MRRNTTLNKNGTEFYYYEKLHSISSITLKLVSTLRFIFFYTFFDVMFLTPMKIVRNIIPYFLHNFLL